MGGACPVARKGGLQKHARQGKRIGLRWLELLYGGRGPRKGLGEGTGASCRRDTNDPHATLSDLSDG